MQVRQQDFVAYGICEHLHCMWGELRTSAGFNFVCSAEFYATTANQLLLHILRLKIAWVYDTHHVLNFLISCCVLLHIVTPFRGVQEETMENKSQLLKISQTF